MGFLHSRQTGIELAVELACEEKMEIINDGQKR
jgi:hypothetical protein